MLVKGFKDMKKYLPAIAMKGAPAVFDDALEASQDAIVEEILGSDLEARLERGKEEDARLLNLCRRTISVQAFLKSIPEMDLVLTDAGFAVINNADMAPASKERVQALTTTLRAKLDESKDALVNLLLSRSAYDEWRGSEQFARLSDGLIMTFAEFKDVAILNSTTKDMYPESWSDFLKLNSALNVALMSDVAAYISKAYAEEILEKVRDKEAFLPNEKKVIHLIKVAIATIALGDRDGGMRQAIATANFMRRNASDFPTFNASAEAKDLTLLHDGGPIFSMF